MVCDVDGDDDCDQCDGYNVGFVDGDCAEENDDNDSDLYSDDCDDGHNNVSDDDGDDGVYGDENAYYDGDDGGDDDTF